MADFGPMQVTAQGHALIAKVLTRDVKFNFDIVQAGDGSFKGNPESLTELVSHRLDGRIVDVREMGPVTELECIISNEKLQSPMLFSEFGVKADDPDIGSILFAYTTAGDNPGPIGKFNGVWVHNERIVVRVFTQNATNITATIVQAAFATEITFINKDTGLSAENVQDAIRELAKMFGDHIKETPFSDTPHGIRFNRETGGLEIYVGQEWVRVTPGGSGIRGILGTARFGSAHFGLR